MTERSRESLLLPILIPVGAMVAIALVLYGFSRILLSLAPNAATATALVAAVGIMAVAAFVASRRRVTAGALGAFVGAAAGIAMLAGGIAIAVIGPLDDGPEPFHAALAAPEGAIQEGFSADTLAFEPERPIELEFENQDQGVAHNVQIFAGPDDTAPVFFLGSDVSGGATATYEIPPMREGEYFFICQLHPNTAMEGTITVEPGAGAIRVVAEGTAFDTDRLELPADEPVPLALENRDAAEHNLSIYEDDTASGDPLFTFDPFPGPATRTVTIDPLPEGEFYFRCDVHPVMEGTVVVAPEGGGGEGGEGGGEGGGGGGGEGEPSPSPEGGG